MDWNCNLPAPLPCSAWCVASPGSLPLPLPASLLVCSARPRPSHRVGKCSTSGFSFKTGSHCVDLAWNSQVSLPLPPPQPWIAGIRGCSATPSCSPLSSHCHNECPCVKVVGTGFEFLKSFVLGLRNGSVLQSSDCFSRAWFVSQRPRGDSSPRREARPLCPRVPGMHIHVYRHVCR